MIRREDVFPLAALAALGGITALWWAFALWPMPTDGPVWLERARAVCFNTGDTGLPDRSGWILLIGQPMGILALLMVGWGERTRVAVGRVLSTGRGRLVGLMVASLVLAGFGGAAVRVRGAALQDVTLAQVSDVPETYPRLDLPWPASHDLVDQRGEPFGLASLAGRPAIVTFAFAHCEAICPLLVQGARSAREELRGERSVALVIITLDPWRDTPARLSQLAERWQLEDGDFLVGGDVEPVQAALDAWNVPRERDERTGDVSHPALAFLVEPDGTVAYGTTGAPAQIVPLARRMR
jgi:cytochrome oxidase Cu insertion factor (SCO1/SenC/PrrC family)